MVANAPVPIAGAARGLPAAAADPAGCCGTRTCRAIAIRSLRRRQARPGVPARGRRDRAAASAGCARRSAAVVVIADSFVDVHRGVGHRGQDHGDPQLGAARRDRPDRARQRVGARAGHRRQPSLVYSGTLGLKHNPALLVGLAAPGARRRRRRSTSSVVNEGPAVDVLRDEAERLDVPITLLPFQPYERLLRGAGQRRRPGRAARRSRPARSRCRRRRCPTCAPAGRCSGLMPAENLAATLVAEVEGCVLPPAEAALPEAGQLGRRRCSRTPAARDELGRKARALAEREFALDGCATRFEEILGRAAGVATVTRLDIRDDRPLVETCAG